MDFSIFKNKYRISGNLEVLTALHIGSGVEENGLDAPFITVDGNSKNKNFYIPGSSFRGYLSTKLERLLAKENGFKFVDKERMSVQAYAFLPVYHRKTVFPTNSYGANQYQW